MNWEEFGRARRRIRGPLFEAQAYLGLSMGELVACDEGRELYSKAQADLAAAVDSAGRLLAYAARMNGFDQ